MKAAGILHVLLILALAAALLLAGTATAWAASGDHFIDLSDSFAGGQTSLGWLYNEVTNAFTITDDVTILGDGTTKDYSFVVVNNATITLENAEIDVSADPGKCAFAITGNASVTLNLVGTSRLTSGEGRAGLEVAFGKELTIVGTGTGKLYATGGAAINGSCGAGAGIGSSGADVLLSNSAACGDITIQDSAIVYASGGDGDNPGAYAGAGIGSGGAINNDVAGVATSVKLEGNSEVTATAGAANGGYDAYSIGPGGGSDSEQRMFFMTSPTVNLRNPSPMVFGIDPGAVPNLELFSFRFSEQPSAVGFSIPYNDPRIVGLVDYDETDAELSTTAAVFQAHQTWALSSILEGDYRIRICLTDDVVAQNEFYYYYVDFHLNSSTPKSGGGGSSARSYIVSFESSGGSAVARQTVLSGNKAQEPTAPKREGYNFTGWYTEKALAKLFDFESKIYADTTLYAGWEEIPPPAPRNPFGDVKPGDWFYGDVLFVYENGLMTGISESEFGPNLYITRAMLITILYRHAGQPDVSGLANPFSDVAAGKWYTNAIIWAAAEGIIAGYEDNTFLPNAIVTRQDLALILWRYAKFAGIDVSAGENSNILSFSDAFSVDEYAIAAMQWACGAGVIGSKPGGFIDPKGSATRAEVAAMLHRMLGNE